MESWEQKYLQVTARFNPGGSKAGVQWADGVECKTTMGSVVFGLVAITGEIVIGKLIVSIHKTATPWSLVMIDPLGQKTSFMFPGLNFIHDSVAYLPHFYEQCEMKHFHI